MSNKNNFENSDVLIEKIKQTRKPLSFYHFITLSFSRFRAISFPFYVARRYFFSKKSHNAVNVITGVSAGGIGVAAMAMVCVMSIFNGIESLITDMFSAFDPDLKITVVQGKTFSVFTDEFETVRNMPSVAVFAEVIEENAMINFRDRYITTTVKGIDQDDFRKMTRIDDIMFDGDFVLFDGGFERIVPGIGVASTLGLGAFFLDPISLYAPRRTARVNLLRPEASFNRVSVFISGVFEVQPQYDDSYVLISLNQARSLFEYDEGVVSAVELKIADGVNHEQTKREIQQILGDRFRVRNRFEQQESVYRIMQMEKWMTYLILSFILLIASFNIIGSLSMLIIDKKKDIETLRNLGANNRLIKRIFLFEGWLISIVGALCGIFIGTLLCLLQQNFGLLRMGNYIADAYPVVVQVTDILVVFATVLVMGFVAAYYPVRYIQKQID